ncbi:MAG: class I SAM-dependent methyltransferase [Leptolyngbya sp. SIO4C1]|nr:class I SAM-dependent methyltransferase [Leptolyngbya sp. SIO4C1]
MSQDAASWQERIQAVARRYDRDYAGKAFDIPAEVEEMPIFRDWVAGTLAARIASPFWELARFRKGQRCLDLGCGLSFLVYPWKDWQTFFYGQDISSVAQQALNQRGPQLDSKLFKGVKKAPAHLLDYDSVRFDAVIATGVTCYYALDYWQRVIDAVRPVLQPGGVFIFDAINPDLPAAENWAILETYLGAEVELTPLKAWRQLIRDSGGRIVKHQSGEVFELYKVSWS